MLGNIKYVGATVRVSYFGTRVPGWHRCERQRCSFPPTGHIFSDAMPSALPNRCCMIQTELDSKRRNPRDPELQPQKAPTPQTANKGHDTPKINFFPKIFFAHLPCHWQKLFYNLSVIKTLLPLKPGPGDPSPSVPPQHIIQH